MYIFWIKTRLYRKNSASRFKFTALFFYPFNIIFHRPIFVLVQLSGWTKMLPNYVQDVGITTTILEIDNNQ